MSDSEKFEQWAVVEVFGHECYAGLVSEAVIGGCSFVRVDVPELPEDEFYPRSDRFTKLLGQNAIFSITPTTEEVARAVAMRKRSRPLNVYTPSLAAPSAAARRAIAAAEEVGDDEDSCRDSSRDDDAEEAFA